MKMFTMMNRMIIFMKTKVIGLTGVQVLLHRGGEFEAGFASLTGSVGLSFSCVIFGFEFLLMR